MQLPAGVDPDTLVREQGLEDFELRISSAQTLSDYFFERLSQGLNLSDMEGRASLINKAKTYLQKLPNGIFQDLMQDKLKSLSKVEKLDFFKNPTTLKTLSYKQKQADKKLSPVRIVISLLLQNPDFIELIEQKEIKWSMINLAGADLLKQVVEIITQHPNINQPQLIEHFRGQKAEKYINIMMNHDFLISDGLKEEFSGAIDILIQEGKNSRFDELNTKQKISGLSTNEQQEMLSLVGPK